MLSTLLTLLLAVLQQLRAGTGLKSISNSSAQNQETEFLTGGETVRRKQLSDELIGVTWFKSQRLSRRTD